MIAERLRMTVDMVAHMRNGPTKLVASDGSGFRLETYVPHGRNGDADAVKKGDVVWITIEREISSAPAHSGKKE